MSKGIFEVCDESEVPQGTRIYGTRFVDETKVTDEGKEMLKSRLVSQNYNDKNALQIPIKSPTISRMGQRIGLTLIAIGTKKNVKRRKRAFLRDVKQAYTQAKSKLEREIFLRPVPEMNLPSGKVLKALKVLYGMPEAGLHWFLTFESHHTKKLDMYQATADKCLFFKKDDAEPVPNVVIVQVDDALGAGSEDFLQLEDEESANFITKPRRTFEDGSKYLFNGFWLEKEGDGFFMHQEDTMDEICKPNSEKEAISVRAKYLPTRFILHCKHIGI